MLVITIFVNKRLYNQTKLMSGITNFGYSLKN